ncbi:Arabinanase/levansucrase/invertase [Ceratobasidium sp. AG-I]|nr:Arabinanase/levansucrase/invertase [Ceratobasidium sp. AG-I]
MRYATLLVPLVGALAASAGPFASNATRYDSIVPGANWLDTDGVLIQAHGGGMVRTSDGTFYWFGEDHRPGGTHFTGIAVYSSKDLYNWKNEGLALSPVAGTPAASDQVGERPKVVWSEETKQWVLYFHSDNPSYALHLQGIGLSPNITGPYAYQGSYQPLGAASQDLGMYVDDDGQAYALYGSGGNNLITRLNSARTNESETIYRFSGTNLEAPGMFKENGTYYHIFSQKTGYRPNDAQLYTAPALTGPWTKQVQLAPAGTHTWESQNTFELKINGTQKTTHIFMGDRWDRDELSDSRYMWLPFTIGGAQPASLEWHDVWKIDVKTGIVTYPKGTSYEAETGTLAGNATITACTTCSGGNFVTNSTSVTISGIAGTGAPQWLAIYYVNTDAQTTALHRYASVSVNGAAGEVVKQRTTDVGVVVSVPLQVQFTKGSKNNITISGVSGRRKFFLRFRLVQHRANICGI